MVANSDVPIDRSGNGGVIGIESTAHTFSFGLVDSNGDPLPPIMASVRPDEGGIHPREAADHHAKRAPELLKLILEQITENSIEISGVAFSQGPGLGPCLRVGASVARALATHWNVPLIGVNHCIAHLEVGRKVCGVEDPVLLYASGGNTQIITKLAGRYRLLGETLDIGIGNMLDKFARSNGIPFPGGPVIEMKSTEYISRVGEPEFHDLELPYAVQGMDLAFSGLLTAAKGLTRNGKSLDAVCWSLQEHAFSACVEVAERAMAHTGKKLLLLGGGVACNQRLQQMCTMMAEERGGESFAPPNKYLIDNGSMIALLGQIQLRNNMATPLDESAINQHMRTDEMEIPWD